MLDGVHIVTVCLADKGLWSENNQLFRVYQAKDDIYLPSYLITILND